MTVPISTAATTRTPALPVLAMRAAMPPTIPEAGKVKHQASSIRQATFQRTDWRSLPSPAPRMLPAHTCVVESGNPACEDTNSTTVEVVSAEKPWGASILTSLWPMV
ncbi:Uncharacterised protein [Mycobacteroides abscessus subsp. massiliense]|nr:Uncharacterised protein [Mycobacteroides abscessus subsp. massiliense]